MRYLYLFSLLFLLATPAYAAQVFLDVRESTFNRLDTFYVPVRLDTQGECINAVRVAIAYDPTELSVEDVSIGQSILTLWTETPIIHKDSNKKEVGRVTFEGGIPGGYCGRVEGDPGLTNTLVQLAVTGVPQALMAGSATSTLMVVEPMTRVFLHDGSGTEVEPTLRGATLNLVQSTDTPNDRWLVDVQSDTISPEFFEIILVEGPSAGNGQHYIAFSTTDKQSGVDHYEVLETDPDRFGFLSWVQTRQAYWLPAKSPYVLRDQRLHSKIMVKAIDKNGNERIAVYTPPMSPLVELTRPSVFIPLGVLLVLLVVLVYLIVRFRHARKASILAADKTREADTPGDTQSNAS